MHCGSSSVFSEDSGFEGSQAGISPVFTGQAQGDLCSCANLIWPGWSSKQLHGSVGCPQFPHVGGSTMSLTWMVDIWTYVKIRRAVDGLMPWRISMQVNRAAPTTPRV